MSNACSVKAGTEIKALDLVYISIGAALIAVCSWISIPTAVPFTLQTFAVFFVLLLLGGERGTIATLIYVLLGAVGLPVFAGFKGGLDTVFGMTGGFIVSFPILAFVAGIGYQLAVKAGKGFRFYSSAMESH